MRVSLKTAIVIVNWNAGNFLFDCLVSAIKQTKPADRIIVVDNASTDGSLSAIEKFQDNQVEILRVASNLGFAAANNLVIQHLDGIDWVALLNPDAVASPDWLEQLLSAAERYPQCCSFASRMMSMDDSEVIDGTGDCYHFTGAVWRRFHGVHVSRASLLTDQKVFGACGGAAFYHRDTFMQLGGFDESYFCYCEDVDLAFRMQLIGGECRYINRAMVSHKGGGTTGDSSEFADYYGHRNLVWTWVKNMPLVLLVLFLPLHILVNVLMVVMAGVRGRGSATLRAKVDAIRGINNPLSKRSEVQIGRKISLLGLWCAMNKSLWRF
jgi:GT2 family glycosyltransferase